MSLVLQFDPRGAGVECARLSLSGKVLDSSGSSFFRKDNMKRLIIKEVDSCYGCPYFGPLGGCDCENPDTRGFDKFIEKIEAHRFLVADDGIFPGCPLPKVTERE